MSTASKPQNEAAWIVSENSHPLQLKPVGYFSPAENEITIENKALSINPIDFKLQTTAKYPLDYPTVLGQDVAGKVVEVGPSVSGIKPGDRVVGQALKSITKQVQHAGFMKYTVLKSNMTSLIPDKISFEQAVVLPLGLSTAAAGLFQKTHLALPLPTLSPKPTGTTLLVWGGASSVGSNAIQLAVAAGVEVIATASPKNFGYVKKMGASQVLDYNSKTIVQDLVAVLKGKKNAGAYDSIGINGAQDSCVAIQSQLDSNKKVVTVATPPHTEKDGVQVIWLYAYTIAGNEVGGAVWNDFLQSALAAGKYQAAPEPLVIGSGLNKVQEGMDLLAKGVSAKKVVITL